MKSNIKEYNKINLNNKIFKYENIDYNFFGLLNEHIFKQVPWYEKKLLEHIKQLNLNGTYIDVGGNIGNHSLYFLNHCNCDELYVFEPESFCYNILQKNLETNAKKTYHLQKKAIWDKKAKLKLIKYETLNNTGTSKVIDSNNDGDINADSLDNLIPFNKKITLIKIDAEKNEPKIIKGAINLITLNEPIIICEAETEIEFNLINDILIPLGYNKPQKKYNATPTYIWVK